MKNKLLRDFFLLSWNIIEAADEKEINLCTLLCHLRYFGMSRHVNCCHDDRFLCNACCAQVGEIGKHFYDKFPSTIDANLIQFLCFPWSLGYRDESFLKEHGEGESIFCQSGVKFACINDDWTRLRQNPAASRLNLVNFQSFKCIHICDWFDSDFGTVIFRSVFHWTDIFDKTVINLWDSLQNI